MNLDRWTRDSIYDTGPLDNVMTPILAIYPDIVRKNIANTGAMLGGDFNRWRPHVKTAKLGSIMRLMVEEGIRQIKCATTLELLVACQVGAQDILVAYPHTGANAHRIAQIARQFPSVRVSGLVEAPEQIDTWRGTSVSLFVDLNPGMNRTGVDVDQFDSVVAIVRKIRDAGVEFRGLHYYDGHVTASNLEERTHSAHAGYERLLRLISHLERCGPCAAAEVITSGTATFPCAMSYHPFRGSSFLHRVSPGTLVYCDLTSLSQLPDDPPFMPAALVIARVISHPHPGIITCDAGHKAVSVDMGVPNCLVLESPEMQPLHPSEEHLPIRVPEGLRMPALGETVRLVPRHVCPTVNNFENAVIISGGSIIGVEKVTARGRESPLLPADAVTA